MITQRISVIILRHQQLTSVNIECNSIILLLDDVKVFIWRHTLNMIISIVSFATDKYCQQYCQNGTCIANQTAYSCTCPPGTRPDYALNCARKYRCLMVTDWKSCCITACPKGLAGPNCQLICNCDFGICNVSATSEDNKCNCATGYAGLLCSQNINFCETSKWLTSIFLVQSLLLLSLQTGTYVQRVLPTKFVNLLQPIVMKVRVV